MNKLINPGRAIFTIGIVALGILCIIYNDFIVGRPPAWPASLNFNPWLAYVSGVLLILAGVGILFNVKPGLCALVIALLIFVLSVLRCLPTFMNDWLNLYKSLALVGGALVVAASFFKDNNVIISNQKITAAARKNLVVLSCFFLAAFFIAGGYAHFKFAAFVETLIPEYIPFRLFWTYFCGICLLAGGVGILIPRTRKLASLLSGIMVAGWFVLLHIPRFIANTSDASERMGLCESFTFVGIFFVLAGLSERE
jgi:uncharacterized membrane protein